MKTLAVLGLAMLLGGCADNEKEAAYSAGYYMGYTHSTEGHVAQLGHSYRPESIEGNKWEYVGVGNETIYGGEDVESLIKPYLHRANLKKKQATSK